MLLLAGAVTAHAEPTLSRADLRFIEQALGAGVVGSPLPAGTIDNPTEYLALSSSRRDYRMLQGPNAGQQETHRMQAQGSAQWRYQLSNDEAGFLQMDGDGDLVMAGIEDNKTSALTRYSPAEPFIPKGLKPGTPKRLQMVVKVFDLEHPDDLQHEGSLNVSLLHLGNYKVRVPAGQYDAVLLKAHFQGEIGPAHVDDLQYRFFAKGTGLIAMAERRDVSAFILYRDRLDVAKVLAAPAP